MFGNIPESDWRHFKRVHELLLERFCRQVLDDLADLLRAEEGTAHERYQRVYTLIKERDKDLADAFDDYRRSTAIMQLTLMRRMGLLGDEELSVFSDQTQAIIRRLDSLGSGEPGAPPGNGR
ncbi:peptide ABC transporter substrate-binding protein [bacterium]|nr:peptide ABC transporter substrate-binding protein [bacterium]